MTKPKLITNYKEGVKEWEIEVQVNGKNHSPLKPNIKLYRGFTEDLELKDVTRVICILEGEMVPGKLAIALSDGKLIVERYHNQTDKEWICPVVETFQLFSLIDEDELERRHSTANSPA